MPTNETTIHKYWFDRKLQKTQLQFLKVWKISYVSNDFHHWLQPTVTEATIDVGDSEDHQSKEQVGFFSWHKVNHTTIHQLNVLKRPNQTWIWICRNFSSQQPSRLDKAGRSSRMRYTRTLDSQCYNLGLMCVFICIPREVLFILGTNCSLRVFPARKGVHTGGVSFANLR